MKNCLLRALGIATCGILAMGIAAADPLCSASTMPVTLVPNQTVNNGQLFSITGEFSGGASGCTVGSLDFNNFQIYTNSGFSTTGFSMTVSFTGSSLSFGTSLSAGQDIELEYEITPGISSMSMSAGPGGGVSETICSSEMNIGPPNAGVCAAEINGGTLLGTASIGGSGFTSFTVSPSKTDWIFKDINGVSEFTQTFSAVPEPMTLSLIGVGLLGIGILRRRRVSK